MEQTGKPPPRLSVVRRTPFPLGTGQPASSSQMRRPSMATKADEKRQAGEWHRPGLSSGAVCEAAASFWFQDREACCLTVLQV